MVVLKVVRGVQRHFMFRLPEWAASLNLFAFSVILLSPGDTFSSSPSYRVMASYATETTWGVYMAVVASVRLIALLLNGTFPVFARYSPAARSVCSLLGSVVWFVLALSFLYSNPVGTGWANYGVWLVVDALLAIHVAGEAGPAWRARPHGHTA